MAQPHFVPKYQALFTSFKVMAYKPHSFVRLLFQGVLRDLSGKISRHATGVKTHS